MHSASMKYTAFLLKNRKNPLFEVFIFFSFQNLDTMIIAAENFYIPDIAKFFKIPRK